jgi:hypothetical protein
MNLSELTQEIIGRGFNYESTTIIESAVQRHYQRLESKFVWPWREATKEGTAPFEIKDLRDVLSVADTSTERPLYGQTRQWLVERFPNLEETGEPLWWWLDNLTLRTFPVSTSENIQVRYAKKPVALTASSEPAMPSEWQYLIVDSVIVDLLKSNDEYSVARELKESIQTDLAEMVAAELQRDLQSPRLTVRTGRAGTYL